MRAFKIIGIIVVLLIVVTFVGGYFLVNNMGSLIKYAVETSGPGLTKTAVSLNGAEVDLAGGSARLDGFQVGNPQGFDSDYLFNLGSMLLEIDTTSLRNEVIVLQNLSIDGIEVQVEQKGSRLNLWQLQKNLASGSTESDARAETSGGREQKFMIENLHFAAGRIKFISDEFGETELRLPTLTVEDLGDRTQGLTAEQLGVAILTPLLNNAKKAVETELKGKLGDNIEATIKEKLGEGWSDKINDSQSIENAKQRLKNLF